MALALNNWPRLIAIKPEVFTQIGDEEKHHMETIFLSIFFMIYSLFMSLVGITQSFGFN